MANKRNHTRFVSEYKTIDVYIINAGKQIKFKDHSFGPFANTYHVLQYVKFGKGYFYCNGKKYEVGPGDLFFLPKNTPTSYCADRDDPYEYYWIAFDGVYANELLDKCHITANNPVVHVDSNSMQKSFSQAYKILKKPTPGNTVKELSLFYSIFAELLDLFANGDDPDPYMPAFNKIVKYIDTNYNKPINISDICDYFHVNRPKFYTQFKEAKGISPKDYIIKMKMSTAVRLLESTNMTLEAIANEIGMAKRQFISMFEKTYSCTPTEYRKQLTDPKVVHNL